MKKQFYLPLQSSLGLSAQTDKPIELNCYNKWSIKFEERGADPVADGIYDDVIISNRQGFFSQKCFNGAPSKNGSGS